MAYVEPSGCGLGGRNLAKTLLVPLQSMIGILPAILPNDVPASPLLATGNRQD
jgi:hypothetical protein